MAYYFTGEQMLAAHRAELQRDQLARPQLNKLKDAVYALKDRYIVHGAVPLVPAAVWNPKLAAAGLLSPSTSASELQGLLKITGPAFGTLALPASLKDAQASLRALATSCTPAPFGRGRETVLDPAVRRALALPASDFRLEGIGAAELAAVFENVRATLVPDALHVDAVLDKLNLYLPEGHFAKHRDTPGDPSHFGTLVLCLPLVFVGGQLTVEHNGVATALHWDGAVSSGRDPLDAASSRWSDLAPFQQQHMSLTSAAPFEGVIAKVVQNVPAPQVQYAAFFGHCEHAIAPVTFGARLTISYKLLRRDTVPVPTPLAAAPVGTAVVRRARHFTEVLRASLMDPAFLPDGGRIGFACFHLYEDAELPPSAAAVDMAAAHALQLKGTDYLVAAGATACGLTTKALRIVSAGGSDDHITVARFPASAKLREYAMRVLVEDEFEDWGVSRDILRFTLGRGDAAALEEAVWAVPLPTAAETPANHTALNETPMTPLRQTFYAGEGSFGNEASLTTIYTHAALIVAIPPASERGARPAIAAAGARRPQEGADNATTVLAEALARRPAANPAADAERESKADRIKSASLATLKSLARACVLAVSGSKGTVLERILPHVDRITEPALAEAGVPLVRIVTAKDAEKAEKRAASAFNDALPPAFKKAALDWSATFFG